jgi:hypothetical protein
MIVVAITRFRRQIVECRRTLSKKPNELKSSRSDEPDWEQERHQSGTSCTAVPEPIR